MTPKQMVRVDLTEIVTIDISCPSCKAVSSLPIPAPYLTAEFRCLGCNVMMWGQGAHEPEMAFKHLVEALTTWKNFHSKASFTLGFSVDAAPSHVSDSKA